MVAGPRLRKWMENGKWMKMAGFLKGPSRENNDICGGVNLRTKRYQIVDGPNS